MPSPQRGSSPVSIPRRASPTPPLCFLPDPYPLITNHCHLSALINCTISLHSSHSLTVWSQTFHDDLPDPLTFCLLTSCSSFPIAVLHSSCAPPSPCSIVPFGFPEKSKGLYHSDKPLETCPFPPAYLDTLLISFSSAANQ